MKRMMALMLALTMAAAMAGCKTTPEEPAVIGKNVDILIDKATKTDGETATPAPTGPDNRAILAEKLGVPERFTANSSFSDGMLTYAADVQIELPDAAALPVMRVEPADFSQELVTKVYGYLVGDTPMYQQQLRMTKERIEEELVFWRQILKDPDSAKESKAQAEEKIAELEKGYGSAPGSAALISADATIGTQQEIDIQTGKVRAEYIGVDLAEIPGLGVQDGKTFSIRNNSENGEIIREENVGGFTVTDTASKGARFYYLNSTDREPDKICQVRTEVVKPDGLTDRPERICGFSYQDAMDMAQGFLDAAGIEGMQIDSVGLVLVLPGSYNDLFYGANVNREEQETAMADAMNGKFDGDALDVRFELELVRTANGIPVMSEGISSYLDDAWGKQWYYESFSIVLDSKGIQGVAWTSPHKIIETVTEDANMRPFSEIAEIFDNMFRVTYDAQGMKNEVQITRVTLTLRRIMEQNNIGYGLFVPVWNFYGTQTVSYPDYPEEPPMRMASVNPLLIINGIDGTVIDIDKGY